LAEEDEGGVATAGAAFTIERIDTWVFNHSAIGSRWVLNFTVELDCASILPYGTQSFPAERSHGLPRNYKSLPFPIVDSPCQPIALSGIQTTRDRPFTIAEMIMQETAEAALTECIFPPESQRCYSTMRYGVVPPGAVAPIGGFVMDHIVRFEETNCTIACPTFLECVHAKLLSNRTQAAKLECLSADPGVTCAARTVAQFAPSVGGGPFTRSGFEGICIDYTCLECIVAQYDEYFSCAVTCTTAPTDVVCVDCSYNYDNSHHMLLRLHDRLWEAYFLNLLGEYAVEDMLTANFTTCATRGHQCLKLQRYRQLALGVDDTPSFLNTGIEPEEETQ